MNQYDALLFSFVLGTLGVLIRQIDLELTATCVSLSANNEHVYLGLVNGQVQKWLLNSAHIQWSFESTQDDIVSLCMLDENTVALGTNKGKVILVSKKAGQEEERLQVPLSSSSNNESLAWMTYDTSLTALFIVNASRNRAWTLLLEDNENIEPMEFPADELKAPLITKGSPICVTANHEKLVIGCVNGDLFDVDIESGQFCKSEHSESQHGLKAMSSNDKYVATLLHTRDIVQIRDGRGGLNVLACVSVDPQIVSLSMARYESDSCQLICLVSSGSFGKSLSI